MNLVLKSIFAFRSIKNRVAFFISFRYYVVIKKV